MDILGDGEGGGGGLSVYRDVRACLKLLMAQGFTLRSSDVEVQYSDSGRSTFSKVNLVDLIVHYVFWCIMIFILAEHAILAASPPSHQRHDLLLQPGMESHLG